MDNVSVLSALVGFGIIAAAALWFWKERNAKRFFDAAKRAEEQAKATAKEAAAQIKAKAKK